MHLGATDPQIQARQEIEAKVVEKIVDAALGRGWTVAVDQGDEGAVSLLSTDKVALLDELMECDEDAVIFLDGDTRLGWIRLIYGNGGWDVMADYTANLKDFVDPIQKFADKYEDYRNLLRLTDQLVADFAKRKAENEARRGQR